MELSKIEPFLEGNTILITGATGFLAKSTLSFSLSQYIYIYTDTYQQFFITVFLKRTIYLYVWKLLNFWFVLIFHINTNIDYLPSYIYGPWTLLSTVNFWSWVKFEIFRSWYPIWSLILYCSHFNIQFRVYVQGEIERSYLGWYVDYLSSNTCLSTIFTLTNFWSRVRFMFIRSFLMI